jgi:hypothetical protein
LGILTLASLIAALALSGQTAGYLHDSLTDNMNSYAEDDNSIQIIDAIQTNYQCCGVNLWLDWARVSLGSSGQIGKDIISVKHQSELSICFLLVSGRRRRQHSSLQMDSPLTRALRQKREVISSSGTVYNLPSSYTVNLPLSCCKSGGVTSGNSLGGCEYLHLS